MTNREDIAAKVKGIIASQLDMDISDINDDMDVSKVDSLKQVEIVLGIEDKFSLQIPEATAEKWQEIGDVIDYIQNQSNA